MFKDIFMVLFSLGFILLCCVFFTNAIEWLGNKLNLGVGVVGSIFAAIGTALPETVIPIIAIVIYRDERSREIGIGAIAGAPFMLATLAMFVTGTAVVVYSLLGRRGTKIQSDPEVLSRDLSFFLLIYGTAVLTTLFHKHLIIKGIIAVLLLLSYILYVRRTFSDHCDQCENLDALYFSRIFRVKTGIGWIILQLAASLAGILYGAHLFVHYVEGLSTLFGISPLILSIIITPIATELPEKLNSVLWTGRSKDTLALGNITGAMVFQSCFPVVFGMLFTSWNLTGITLASAMLALAASAFYLVWVKLRKIIHYVSLLMGGVFYGAFLLFVFTRS